MIGFVRGKTCWPIFLTGAGCLALKSLIGWDVGSVETACLTCVCSANITGAGFAGILSSTILTIAMRRRRATGAAGVAAGAGACISATAGAAEVSGDCGELAGSGSPPLLFGAEFVGA